MPVDAPRFDGAVHEAVALTRWYAREHLLLCLTPALVADGEVKVACKVPAHEETKKLLA